MDRKRKNSESDDHPAKKMKLSPKEIKQFMLLLDDTPEDLLGEIFAYTLADAPENLITLYYLRRVSKNIKFAVDSFLQSLDFARICRQNEIHYHESYTSGSTDELTPLDVKYLELFFVPEYLRAMRSSNESALELQTAKEYLEKYCYTVSKRKHQESSMSFLGLSRGRPIDTDIQSFVDERLNINPVSIPKGREDLVRTTINLFTDARMDLTEMYVLAMKSAPFDVRVGYNEAQTVFEMLFDEYQRSTDDEGRSFLWFASLEFIFSKLQTTDLNQTNNYGRRFLEKPISNTNKIIRSMTLEELDILVQAGYDYLVSSTNLVPSLFVYLVADKNLECARALIERYGYKPTKEDAARIMDTIARYRPMYRTNEGRDANNIKQFLFSLGFDYRTLPEAHDDFSD